MASDDGSSRDSIAQRHETRFFLASLAKVASQSIQRQDSDSPVFHGCYDWHSAVHSHWMLIRYSRVTQDPTFDEQVKESLLRSGGMQQEEVELRHRSSFEMPYGRAWLLRLAIEFETHFNDASLRPIADVCYASLLGHFTLSQSASSPEYSNPCFALAQMVAHCHFRNDKIGLGQIFAEVIQPGFFPAQVRFLSFTDDHDGSGGFFSLFGNWIHLHSTLRHACQSMSLNLALPSSTDIEESLGILEMNLQARMAISGVHALGLNPSRAWALADLAWMMENEKYLDFYRDHVAQIVAAHCSFAGDYYAYDHWVPSFVMYAVTEPFLLGLPDPFEGREDIFAFVSQKPLSVSDVDGE